MFILPPTSPPTFAPLLNQELGEELVDLTEPSSAANAVIAVYREVIK
jgi:hypothetical protein